MKRLFRTPVRQYCPPRCSSFRYVAILVVDRRSHQSTHRANIWCPYRRTPIPYQVQVSRSHFQPPTQLHPPYDQLSASPVANHDARQQQQQYQSLSSTNARHPLGGEAIPNGSSSRRGSRPCMPARL